MVLPATIVLVSVAVPPSLSRPPPPFRGGVAADGAIGQRQRAAGRRRLQQAAAGELGGVAADGAIGQRGRAVELYRPPPSTLAELPLTVQLVSVAVPRRWPGRRRRAVAVLPLTVQLVSVSVPLVVQAAAVAAAGVAAGDGQPRDRRGDATVDLEHPAGLVAADGQQVRAGPVIVRVPVPSARAGRRSG